MSSFKGEANASADTGECMECISLRSRVRELESSLKNAQQEYFKECETLVEPAMYEKIYTSKVLKIFEQALKKEK